MHIAEGFLPANWCLFWYVIFIPVLVIGFKKLQKIFEVNAQSKILYAVIGAFVFVLSSMKLPSVAGSSSHLTGIALGALLFEASTMTVIGLIVLIFQALLLAHGGISTLGANAFSMTVVGSFIAVWTYKGLLKCKIPQTITLFIAAYVSNISIYICTSFQLSLAFQTETNSLWDNAIKFMSVFAITQIPLAVIEGILTVMLWKLIMRYNEQDIFSHKIKGSL